MSDRPRRLVKVPTFGFFRDGTYQKMDVQATGPGPERFLPTPPEKSPLQVAAEFSNLLRADLKDK